MAIRSSRHILQAWLHGRISCAMLVVLCAVCGACSAGDDEASAIGQAMRVDVDWSQSGGGVPEGMTLLLTNADTGGMTRVVSDDVLSCVTPALPPGRYRVMVFNHTEEDSGGIRFRNLESADEAGAYAAEHAGTQWCGPHPADGYVARQPGWLAVGTMMTGSAGDLPHGINQPDSPAVTLYPRDIISTLHLALRISGAGNMVSARAALGGFASGKRLADGMPDDSRCTVTHIVQPADWSVERLPDSSGDAIISAGIRCFGLPSGHSGRPGANRLQLEVLLADGHTVVEYELPVGHLICKSTSDGADRDDGLDLSLDLSIAPALPPCGGGGGVDVWFEDWDEDLDFDIPL